MDVLLVGAACLASGSGCRKPDAGSSASPAEVSRLPPPAEAAPLDDEEARLVSGAVASLAADLYPRLAADRTNMAFSPTSILLALAMTSGGARGETAAEMNAVMHLGDDPDRTRALLGRAQRVLLTAGSESVQLAVANRLFGERTYRFRPEFLEWTAAEYAAPLEAVDFRGAFEAVRGGINDWVAEQTRDRIPVILPERSVDPDTRLVLVNAIYFKGRWALVFEPEATVPRPFTLADGTKVEVPTMAARDDFGYAARDGAQLLELPYAGDALSMVVVLPAEGAAPDPWLTAERLAGLGRLPVQEVEVRLPRFRIDPPGPCRLEAELQALGMERAFDPGAAEFEGMADPPNPDDRLYVSAVFHRAFVEVNEEGTEAAAATAVVMAPQGMPPSPREPLRFHADRPFLFLIRENRTGLVLFAGRVGDPRPAG
ncbi:MAG: serpin family protein [Deltaproteobacteria bacterium]|nr:serpin family protein [Deltaproteobacteria bacterium]